MKEQEQEQESEDSEIGDKWERVDSTTWRLCVPGGWLVQVASLLGVAVTFFPDASCAWDLSESKAPR